MKMKVGEPRAKHIHVFLNGEEVSRRCFAFEGPDIPNIEGPGSVGLFKVEDGQFVIDYTIPNDPDIATEYLSGLVRWIEIQP